MARHIYGGRAPTLMGIEWSLCLIATLLIMGRLFHRFTSPSPGAYWPLTWSIISWSFGIASIVSLTVSVSYGLCMRIHELERDQVRLALEWVWITQAIQIFCYGISKVAVVSFLLELQGPTYRKGRIFLHFLAISNVIVSAIEPPLVMLQCHPPRKLWDPEVPGVCKYGPGTNFGYFQGGWNAATDFSLALYPSLIIWKLQMPRRLKLGLCTLMGLGVLMGVCAIAKSVEIGVVERAKDPISELYRLLSWAQTEMWVTIIIPCITPLYPLFQRILAGVKRHTFSSRRKSVFPASSPRECLFFHWPHQATAKPKKRPLKPLDTPEDDIEDQEAIVPSHDGILMKKSVSVWEGTPNP